ncbi:MAG: DUF5908 family protein [Marinifilaceae bacterium]|jgi:hypothetical protein
MPIEIKELVIRATVDEVVNKNSESKSESGDREENNCCADHLDMIIQMINDKNER